MGTSTTATGGDRRDRRRETGDLSVSTMQPSALALAQSRIAELETAQVEGREARRELDREHSFVQAVLDTIDVGIVACDAEGHLTLFNRATRRMHGISEDPDVDPEQWADRFDLYGADGVTRLAPEDVPLRRALVDGWVSGAVITIAPKGRPAIVVRCDGQRLTALDGTVTGAVAAMTDITDSLRIADRLQRAHREFTQALDAMPRSVTLVGVDRDAVGNPERLRIRWTNAYVRERMGVELSDVVGRPLAEVFPEVAASYEHTYLEVARTGETLRLPIDWFDGVTIKGAFDVTVSLWGEDGLLIDVVDVTARRAVEQALERSEQRLRDAQAAAGLAGWEWDPASGEITWSPLMYAILGVDPAVRPTPDLMLSFIPPEGRDAFAAQVDGWFRSATTSLSVDVPMRRHDGTDLVVRVHATIERDERGRAVRVWGTDQDVTAAHDREAALTAAAGTDSLTGLANRRGWDERTTDLARMRRRGEAVAVAMIDLDHFKAINDSQGHAAGDELLRTCAERWTTRLRSTDVIARVGGEEFAVLLPGCDLATAERVVGDLRAAVPAPYTASAGVTQLVSDELLDAALARADQALYEAKATGRDRLVALDTAAVSDKPGDNLGGGE